MKKKLSILAALAAAALLIFALVSVAQALTAGQDPNSQAGLNNCPSGDWFSNGKPVNAGDLYDAADNVYIPNATQDGCMTMQELSKVQSGLGTIMVEVGYRAGVMPYAARGGNWALADYQAKEMGEAMESGAITRPGNSNALLHFMDNDGLPQVESAIAAKDITAFDSAYTNMITACNACHVARGHSEVVYHTPPQMPADLSLGVGLDLTLSASPAHWASYTDYTNGTLSVDMAVKNVGKDTALATEITGTTNNNGVTSDNSLPLNLGDIGAGGAVNFTLQYNIPQGTGSFHSVVHAQTHDSNGVAYNYPAA